MELAAAPTSPGQARRYALETIDSWGLAVDREALCLIVSELVTNAMLHARSALHVRLERLPHGVRVSVDDASATAPQQRSFSTEAGTGRGLHLVEALAESWGVEHRGGAGKTVWAVLPLEGTT